MATMGKRAVIKIKGMPKSADKSMGGSGPMIVNLICCPIQIQPVATQGFEVPVLGVPIMREGFITETGFLLTAPENSSLVG